MRASEITLLLADALTSALPGWNVIQGSAHDLADRQVDIAVAESSIGKASNMGRYTVLERWVVRLAISTSEIEANYLALLDARDAALIAIANRGLPFGGDAYIECTQAPSADSITARESSVGDLYYETLISFWVTRAIE